MQANIFQGLCFTMLMNVKKAVHRGAAPGRGELHQVHLPSKQLSGQLL